MLLQVSKKQTHNHLHQWELIEGKGYDYDSDHYKCKICRLKIARFFGERESKNEYFPDSILLP